MSFYSSIVFSNCSKIQSDRTDFRTIKFSKQQLSENFEQCKNELRDMIKSLDLDLVIILRSKEKMREILTNPSSLITYLLIKNVDNSRFDDLCLLLGYYAKYISISENKVFYPKSETYPMEIRHSSVLFDIDMDESFYKKKHGKDLVDMMIIEVKNDIKKDKEKQLYEKTMQ